MNLNKQKQANQLRRHMRVRNSVTGTAERPRLAVHRSLNHIYAQIIDDVAGKTLVAASSMLPAARAKLAKATNIDASKAIGADIAARAKAAGITKIVFDRGGFRYHGRVKALAEAARAGGLLF